MGPQLELGATHLVFNTEPNKLAQCSLSVRNSGSTAIYYTWKRLSPDSIVPRHYDHPHQFDLSDILTGVMLPEDEKYFTFSFSNAAAGCYSEEWQLETVPAVPVPLTVQLRAVVISRDERPLDRQKLGEELHKKATRSGLHDFFVQILNQTKGDAFMASEEGHEIKIQEQQQLEERAKEQIREAECQRRWQLHNEKTPFHYSRQLYDCLQNLDAKLQGYAAAVGDPAGSGTGAEAIINAKVTLWSGSLNHLAEAIQQVQDAVVRHTLSNALEDILFAASFQHDDEMQSLAEEQGAGPLFSYAMMHRALMGFADQYVDRMHSLGVAFGYIEEPDLPVAGKKGKDVKGVKKKEEPKKKAPVPDPKVKKVKHDDAAVEGEGDLKRKLQLEYQQRAAKEAKYTVEDLIYQFCSQLQVVEERQSILNDDLCVRYHDRIVQQTMVRQAKIAEERMAQERDAKEKSDTADEDKPVEEKKKKKR